MHGVLTWIYTGAKNTVSARHQPGAELLCRMPLALGAEQPLPRDYGHLSTCKLLKTFFFFFSPSLFSAGWWLVENTDKQIAWFPASYLEDIDVHEDIQNSLSSNEEGKSASVSLEHHIPSSEN